MGLAQNVNGTLRRVPTWPLYALGAVVPGILLYMAATGALGIDPVKGLEHELGELGLQVLIAGLMISPLRRFTGVSLLKFRRALGLVGFFWVFLHLLTWLVLDVQIPSQVWADILKRPYITVGMLGFVLLVPLAATSWNGAVRRMGAKAWQMLHKLTYPAVLLGAVHFVMVQKVWESEPLVYSAIVVLLLLLRLPRRQR